MAIRAVPTRGTGREDYSQKSFTTEALRTALGIQRVAPTTSLLTVSFTPPSKSVSLKNVGDVDCFVERNGDAVVTKGLLEAGDAIVIAGTTINKITFITLAGTAAVDVYPDR